MAERAAGDHGNADARNAGGGWGGEPCRGDDGGDEEGGLVADAPCGVLIDGEGVEGRGVECLAGVAHCRGEGGEFVGAESALEDGHEEGGDLCVGDELVLRGADDDIVNEGRYLGVAEGEAVAFVEDNVDGVDELGHGFKCDCRRPIMTW